MSTFDFVARQPTWNPWILLHANRWAISSLYRRDALDAVGGVPEGTAYEDWDLMLGLAEQDRRGLLVPRVVLHYRQHGVTRRNRAAQSDLRRQYAALRARHAPLFAREPELRRRYRLPPRGPAVAARSRAALPGSQAADTEGRRALRIRGGGAAGCAGTSARAGAPVAG